MNGVALAVDAPSVANTLHDAGLKTALIGKPHFEPFLDPFANFAENRFADGYPVNGHRGFDHFEAATHGVAGNLAYARYMQREHPEAMGGFYPVLDGALEVNAMGGGETGMPQLWTNPIPKEWYHTDWCADRAISWLDSLDADDDFFCWLSFPDPHHPQDVPAAELGRINWRDVDLPVGYIEDRARREAVLDDKPAHWRAWYDGRLVSNYEAPANWVPATLTPDQIREFTAYNAIACELIDEAIGRVLDHLAARGIADDVDVFFSTDHGDLGGDFGLAFKGPYHVDGLMRLPLIWRPAKHRGIAPATVSAPVGLVDLAPTFCEVAGLPAQPYMEGKALPISDDDAAARGFERQLTEWDSSIFGVEVHLRTITRDGWVCTAYLPGTTSDGTDGELYDLSEDPLQQRNLWDVPSAAGMRSDLLADLWAHQPAQRRPLAPLSAPV
jgi:arylsulfatase A-like enzyme